MHRAYTNFQACHSLANQYNACEVQAIRDAWEWFHNTAHSDDLVAAAVGELERVHNLETLEAFEASFDSEGIETEGYSEVSFDPSTGVELSVDDVLELVELIEAGY